MSNNTLLNVFSLLLIIENKVKQVIPVGFTVTAFKSNNKEINEKSLVIVMTSPAKYHKTQPET